jgi:transglutaminase-like putative cysteine protease
VRLAARRSLRLRMRDLAAASAFIAVALSGVLPLAVPALFGVAFVASLFGWRPFSKQPVVSVIVLLIAAVALFGLSFRGQLDLVVAAVAFAALVTGQRMLSEPSAATDQQVLLAGLLLMAGAAALSGDIWYALCLLSFGVFACLSLGLSVVEGPVERDEELPVSPVLRQVSIGVAIALAGGIAFFVLFPRLSWNVASRRAGPGLLGGTTGMTDRVRLGGGGDIKTSARVVMRVSIEPEPRSDRLEKYWVGRHFDLFDGKEWRGTGKSRGPQPRVFLGGEMPRRGGSIVQRIELLPAYDSRTLVGLAQPVIFGPGNALSTAGATAAAIERVGDEEVRFVEDANAYNYTAFSKENVPLFADKGTDFEPLRALPENLDPRVSQLAAQIAGNATTPEEIASRLERYLRSNLAYTLELPGDVDDPLADFLFVRKAGHCEHFATALAIMLRTRGVPARVVGGFFGGEKIGAKYVVRAGDAHAWVEAYSPDKGWLIYDATPDDGRGSQPQRLIAQLVDAYERLQELWRARVVDYSIIDQWNFVRELVKPPGGSGRSANRDDDPDEALPGTKTPTRAIVYAIAAGLLAWAVFARLTRKSNKPHPASDFLAALEKKLTDAHISYRDDEDIEQLPARLARERHRLARPVAQASRRYLEARFGGKPLAPEERRALLAAVTPPSPPAQQR